MILLHMCDTVHAFEFVPSKTRNPGLSVRCRYYQPIHRMMRVSEGNKTCDVYGSGRWHPMSAEKSILYQLNVGSDDEVFGEGYLTLPGVQQSTEYR
jgi:hypothetical protein